MARQSSGGAMLGERIRSLVPAQAVTATRQPARTGVRAPRADVADAEAPPLPPYVAHALARFRLLHDVPFRYLVPDTRLLPKESMRFFTLDNAWLDALAEGAVAVGAAGTREFARTLRALPAAHTAGATYRLSVRDVVRGRIALADVPLPPARDTAVPVVSGFLLHSALVSGWEGFAVRAWTSDSPADVPLEVDPGELEQNRPELVVRILRLDRLSPSVFLALFDGVPRLIWLEEPHHGVQYGVEEAAAGWEVVIRNEQAASTSTRVSVPTRAGNIPGVVDVTALAAAIDNVSDLGTPRGAAALAFQLLQAPSRQRFAASASVLPPARRGVRR